MKGNLITMLLCLALCVSVQAQTEEEYIVSGDDKALQLDFESAIVDYDLALGINPDNVVALIKRGMANAELRLFEEALSDLNKAIELNEESAPAYVARGGAKLDQLDYHDAIQDFNIAIKLDPQSADAYNGRGDAKLDQKDYLGAIMDYDKAIALDGEDAFSHYARGVALIKSGKKNEGCLGLSKAGELGYDEAYTTIKKLCKK